MSFAGDISWADIQRWESDEGPYAGEDDDLTPYDTMTDEERDRYDTLMLAMERNPDLAFTAADLEDY